jgi:hypothetical protein
MSIGTTVASVQGEEEEEEEGKHELNFLMYGENAKTIVDTVLPHCVIYLS